MSQLTAISPAHLAPNRAPRRPFPSFRASGVQIPITSTFPKWNATSNRNTPKLKFLVTHTKQTPAQFLIATFRALVRRTAASFQPAHCPFPDPGLFAAKRGHEILENCLTRVYSNTSKFLIDNFHRHSSSGFSSHSPAQIRVEGPVAHPKKQKTPRLSQMKARGLCRSNRHTYEKLELPLSSFRISETSIPNRHKTALHPRCKRRSSSQVFRRSGGWRELAPHAAAAGKSRGRPARRRRCDSSR